jgi:hypothetical protein
MHRKVLIHRRLPYNFLGWTCTYQLYHTHYFDAAFAAVTQHHYSLLDYFSFFFFRNVSSMKFVSTTDS